MCSSLFFVHHTISFHFRLCVLVSKSISQYHSTMTFKVFRAIILGAPASGKGTISDRIIKRFHFQYISCGDILRQNIRLQTRLGNKAKKYIQDGQLVPDDLVNQCVLNRINAIGNDSWLMDGYPRTISQAEYLWKFQPIESVINLNVPHDVIIERSSKRWIHLPSGRIYNTDFNKPKVPFRDDVTGEELVQREDDKPETMKKRLEIYENCVEPINEFYRKIGILSSFSGRTTDEIWPQIEAYLEKAIK